MKRTLSHLSAIFLKIVIITCSFGGYGYSQCIGGGLTGMDGQTVAIVPTGSTTLYPYAVYSADPSCTFWYPLPGYTFNMYVSGTDGSNGHSHPHDFYLQPAGTVSPSSCTTDSNGNCPGVTYTGTYVAQDESISPFGSTIFHVMYSDISSYQPANPSYVNFRGYRGEHPYNHYGTYVLNSGVDGVASNWYAFYSSPLQVNDMGLPWGGWFDLNTDWSCPHQYHGRGTAVDINGPNGGAPDSGQIANLQSWCHDNGLTITYSESTNFHCEAPDNINRFDSHLCPTTPGATPPGGLSSLQ